MIIERFCGSGILHRLRGNGIAEPGRKAGPAFESRLGKVDQAEQQRIDANRHQSRGDDGIASAFGEDFEVASLRHEDKREFPDLADRDCQ